MTYFFFCVSTKFPFFKVGDCNFLLLLPSRALAVASIETQKEQVQEGNDLE